MLLQDSQVAALLDHVPRLHVTVIFFACRKPTRNRKGLTMACC